MKRDKIILTDKEKQVLQLSANGFTRQQIAEVMGVKVGTIASHMHNILKRTCSTHNGHVIAKAIRLKLIK
ncbi:MAG: LuxR family transcriptional regulator [Caulobacteraceae bacterium]|nr:LuxR family transcriptional regulator [Caulobacteraceae bacterium]